MHRHVACGLLLIASCFVATEARAQWYTAVYLGASHTAPATVSIDQPDLGTNLRIEDVPFESRSFESPQYYGIRMGRLFGSQRRWGVEVEFVHPKVYSRTREQVRVSGRFRHVLIDGNTRMDTFVQRYAMSHGMNLLLVNLVFRTPLVSAGGSDRVALIARAGFGPTFPHGETTIDNVAVEQYEMSDVAVQGAAGIDIAIRGRLSATVDYKIARARPEIAIASGVGRTTTVIHQIALGLAFGLKR